MQLEVRTGSGPIVIDLKVIVRRVRGQASEQVEVMVTAPSRLDGQLTLFQERFPFEESAGNAGLDS
jgi:hypothetical protein